MRRATYSCTSLFPYKLPIPAMSSLTTLGYVRMQRAQGHSFWSTNGHNSAGARAGWTDVHLRLNCLGSNTPEASKVPAYSSALLLLLNLLCKRAGKELGVGSSQCPANLGLLGALSLLSEGTSRRSRAKPSPSWESVGMHRFSVHLPSVWEKILLLGWWQKS